MNQKEHLGVGWNFPVKPANGRLEWARYEDRVQQSIAIILLTAQRERPMLNTFGAASRDFVFEPNSPRTHRALEVSVQKALLEWEPRINVERVEATPDPDQPNLVRIHIDYVVRATNTFYNKVFPFYLVEGTP